MTDTNDQTDKALAVVSEGENRMLTAAPQRTPLTWKQRVSLGDQLVATGFLPSTIKNGVQAAAIMLKGEELGVPRMYALSNIHVVEGRPTCSAELMLALVRRDHGKGAIRVKETTNEKCTVEWREEGWEGASSYTYTIQDAQRAGLTGKGVWQKYPAAMLRARAISAACRMAFPESIAGMHLPEELGANVRVTESGEVEVIEQAPARPAPRPEPEEEPSADEAIEATFTPVEESGEWPQKALSRLHALASEHKVTHDLLHDVAGIVYGVSSMKDLAPHETGQIAAAIDWLAANNKPPATVLQFIAHFNNGRDPSPVVAALKPLQLGGPARDIATLAYKRSKQTWQVQQAALDAGDKGEDPPDSWMRFYEQATSVGIVDRESFERLTGQKLPGLVDQARVILDAYVEHLIQSGQTEANPITGQLSDEATAAATLPDMPAPEPRQRRRSHHFETE